MSKGSGKPKQMAKPTAKPMKLACGGAAKSRKNFPNTSKPPMPKKGK